MPARLIRACDAFFLQFGRNGFQSFQTAFADFGKQVLQGFVVFVKVQTDNVSGAARQVTDISMPLTKGSPRVSASARASASPPVWSWSGQGEQGATVLTGESDDFGWGEHAV